jgi:hypothetical protein
LRRITIFNSLLIYFKFKMEEHKIEIPQNVKASGIIDKFKNPKLWTKLLDIYNKFTFTSTDNHQSSFYSLQVNIKIFLIILLALE